MNKSLNKNTLVLLVGLTLPTLAMAEMDQTLQNAKQLLELKKYSEAYELLEPLEESRAGDTDFDYLLGLAGVEAGKVTRGVFALERVLATDPNNNAARVEIARGHFLLGESESAKIEFQSVKDQNPSPELTTAIDKYMSAIDKSLGLVTSYSAYLEAGGGYDTNINSATGSGSVAVPFFGGLIINPSGDNAEKSDGFLNFGGGISFKHPFGKAFAVFGGVDGYKKVNNSNEQFDTGSLNFNVGILAKQAVNTYTLTAQDGTFYVNGDRYRRAYGVSGQWQHDLDQSNQITAFAQISRLSYPGNDIRDVDRYVVGGGWGHLFTGDKAPVVFLSAYLGTEDERAQNVPHLGHDLYGIRAGGQLTFNPKLVGFAISSYERRNYGGPDPLFLTTRHDNQFDLSAGLQYLPGYNWVIKPQLSYTKNDANIALNEFDRTVISVSFHHDFNW